MKVKTDKQTKELIDKIMKDTTLNTPSISFTNTVMSQVLALEDNSITTYKPLISKTVWCFIIIGFLILIGFVLDNNNEESIGWLDNINFNTISNNRISYTFLNLKMSSYIESKTLSNAFILFGFMICIQIPVLKYYFNKRLGH